MKRLLLIPMTLGLLASASAAPVSPFSRPSAPLELNQALSVPEPGSMALIGLGLIGLTLVSRRLGQRTSR